MNLPGPSSHGRIAACPTSEALPHVNSSSPYSKRGNAIHAFLAACVAVGRDAALLQVDQDYIETLEAIPLYRLPPLDPKRYAAEVSFAVNTKTVAYRELGRNLDRDQARAMAKPDEVVGTADLVGLTDDAVVVFDWKTGYGHVDRAEVNWQTKDYALMVARTYGKDRAIINIVRILDDGTVWYDGFEMDQLDLDCHEVDLSELMAKREEVIAAAPEDRPKLHEGEHCRYCPALPHCPAKMALLKTTFADGDPLAQEVTELTPERAARAWAKIEAAEKLLERLKAIVKEYGRQTPFPTSDGYVVGEVADSKETIVADRAKAALARHFGEQLGAVVYGNSAETKTTVTKAALKASLNRFVLPTLPKERAKITRVERDMLEALRKAGAVSVATYKHVKEHKTKDEPKRLPKEAA